MRGRKFLHFMILLFIFFINCRGKTKERIDSTDRVSLPCSLNKNSLQGYKGTRYQTTTLPSLSEKSASCNHESNDRNNLQIHKNLDITKCGIVKNSEITKTATFIVTFNPNDKKYYLLLSLIN